MVVFLLVSYRQQVEGNYEAPEKLSINKWYHVALTYDQATGKTVMYLNGTK